MYKIRTSTFYRPTVCLVLLALLLGGCTGPRSPQISRNQALAWHDPMEVRVVQVYDGMRHSRDPHVSHLVEVEFIRGESSNLSQGQRFTLPYDSWQMEGKEPPRRGTALLMTPASWVRGSP